MTIRRTADKIQLATLTRILDDYCEQAGIEGLHPAREHLASAFDKSLRKQLRLPV
ncbi:MULTISPECIES: hypothetical protein [Mesorhizobium]|uniref:Integrase n=1 Tax=Mesorhizobium japonicum R7A TaxID=935547 RepID=A0ABX6MPM8_9HYPH|nr:MULTISPECIES: hypothetical protein [Mesorhizobium]MBE1706490.1 hypothetical protein [Mesorhizobium japonicum]MBE1714999.1 hypothetical protein [Mesorhizobium japonicum]QJF01307.1 hypothetical protein R7A2020_10385 [Mesorhizobium japonicum R7A]QJF07378.1 hypothetical protein HID05_10385 [Mesorhizobium japonicum]QJI83249.1 hypothetical protein HKB46_10385 [Mesorhizobium japonicum]